MNLRVKTKSSYMSCFFNLATEKNIYLFRYILFMTEINLNLYLKEQNENNNIVENSNIVEYSSSNIAVEHSNSNIVEHSSFIKEYTNLISKLVDDNKGFISEDRIYLFINKIEEIENFLKQNENNFEIFQEISLKKEYEIIEFLGKISGNLYAKYRYEFNTLILNRILKAIKTLQNSKEINEIIIYAPKIPSPITILVNNSIYIIIAPITYG